MHIFETYTSVLSPPSERARLSECSAAQLPPRVPAQPTTHSDARVTPASREGFRARAMGITCRCDPRYSARASPRCLAPAPAPAPSPPPPTRSRASDPPRLGRGANIARVPSVPFSRLLNVPSLPRRRICFENTDALPSSAHATMPCCGSHLCASCDQLWFATESTCPSCRAPVCRPGGAVPPGARETPTHGTPPPAPPETHCTPPPAPPETHGTPPPAPPAPSETDEMDARAALAQLGDALSSMSSSRVDAQRRVVALEAENDALRRRLRDVEAALTAALDQNRSVAKDDTRRGDPAHPARPADPVSDVGRDDSSATSSLWRFANDARPSRVRGATNSVTHAAPAHGIASHPCPARAGFHSVDVVATVGWDGVAATHVIPRDAGTRGGGDTDGNRPGGGDTRDDGNTRNGAFPVPSRRLAAARHDAGLYAAAFSATHPNVLGVASSDGSLRLAKLVDDEDAETADENGAERSPSSPSSRTWRTPSIVALASLEGHRGEVNDVAFHRAGGPFAATVSDDGTCVTWDAARAVPVGEASGHAAAVYGAAYAPASFGGGDAFATCSFDRTVRVWDPRTPGKRDDASGTAGFESSTLHPVACVATFRGHDDDVVGVDFHPRGTVVASGSDDGTCRAWDLRAASSSVDSNSKGTPRANVASFALAGEAKRVRFSPSGDAIAVGGGDGGVYVADAAMDVVAVLRGHEDAVFDVAWIRGGSGIVSASHDTTWRTWWIE